MRRKKRKKKEAGFIPDVAACLAVRALSFILSLLPLRTAVALGGRVGGLFYYLTGRYRRVALVNLRCAFPEKGEGEIRGIARGTFRNFGMTVVESLLIPKIVKNFFSYVSLESEDPSPSLLAEGRGLIYVTGHMGNWEYLTILPGLLGHPMWGVARPLKHRRLYRYLVSLRETAGIRIIGKKWITRAALQVLRRKEALGIVMDQYAGRRGVFAEFFGRPASTTPAPALFAIRTGAPILPTFCVRKGPLHYGVVIADPVRPDGSAPPEEEVLSITSRLNRVLEEVVRRHPEQWLWLHRRWRPRPSRAGKGGK